MLDLRDLAKELEELKERQTEADCDCGPHTDEFRQRGSVIGTGPDRVLVECVIHDTTVALDDTETERLAALTELDGQLFCGMDGYSRNEPTLILESEFEEYAREFAADVGWSGSDAYENNPLMAHVDWESWAESLKADYTEVEFDDETYLIRAY